MKNKTISTARENGMKIHPIPQMPFLGGEELELAVSGVKLVLDAAMRGISDATLTEGK